MILRSLALFGILLFAVGCAPSEGTGDGAGDGGNDSSNTTAVPVLEDSQLVSVNLVRSA